MPSGPSSCSYLAGSQMLTISMDTRTAHMHAASSEKLKLSRATDWGTASWHEARCPDSSATSENLPRVVPQHSLLGYRTAASGLEREAGLECRLQMPHGTRSHKRPRLEDRLKEGTAVRAFLANRRSKLESGFDEA